MIVDIFPEIESYQLETCEHGVANVIEIRVPIVWVVSDIFETGEVCWTTARKKKDKEKTNKYKHNDLRSAD